MLALLNVRLCFQNEGLGDSEHLLQDTDSDNEDGPIFTIDRGFKGEPEQFVEEVYTAGNEQSDARLDIEDVKPSSLVGSSNIFKKFKYTRRFFR